MVFLDLLVILSITFIFIWLAYKLHFSEVIGLIAAGLFLATEPIRGIFVSPSEVLINDLATIGLFTLMFITGFEISRSMLKQEGDDSFILTFLTILSSFSLGFLIFKILGFSWEASLIVGTCFSITSEATKARSLLQLDEIRTRMGALLLEAGILNDIFGVIALTAISYFFTKAFSVVEIYIISGMILSFVLGMIVHIFFDRQTPEIKILEKVLLHTLVPFFFINMALKFDHDIFTFDFGLFLLVFAVSSSSQMIGAWLSRYFIKLKPKQALLIGVGMNSKGAVELVVAYIALSVGILPKGLYSALVLTSIVSTIIFHLIAYRMIDKDPKLMN